jgi:hypothetical protein
MAAQNRQPRARRPCPRSSAQIPIRHRTSPHPVVSLQIPRDDLLFVSTIAFVRRAWNSVNPVPTTNFVSMTRAMIVASQFDAIQALSGALSNERGMQLGPAELHESAAGRGDIEFPKLGYRRNGVLVAIGIFILADATGEEMYVHAV